MAEDASEMGRRVRHLRQARGKSLAVVAGLAGMSKGYLSRLERGERALDRRSQIVALADALDVAPTDITNAAMGVVRDATDDHALTEVRLSMLAVQMGDPRGEVQPIEQLQARVAEVMVAQNNAQTDVVGAALPALVRDLHTTAAAHHAEPEVLRLLALTHMQGTQAWLVTVGAPVDLSWQAATMARQAAECLDEPLSLAVSAYGTALSLLATGAFKLGSRALAEIELPLLTPQELQVAGSLTLASSLLAAAENDHARRTAALEHAADLAAHTGESNALGFGFGPSNVAVWRLQGALEVGDHAEAVRIAEEVDPSALTVRARRAVYWREYGRALARTPRRYDDAVLMLRRAEKISPEHVQRHPFTVSVLAEMVSRAKRDAVGRELRGMAYRAGLPV